MRRFAQAGSRKTCWSALVFLELAPARITSSD